MDNNTSDPFRRKLTALDFAIRVGLHTDLGEDDIIKVAEKFDDFMTKGLEADDISY